jgi:3'-phosphoadenosine 5'-phosphosulfate sulfotransferase (PAPS reductase)/FAD synthetase
MPDALFDAAPLRVPKVRPGAFTATAPDLRSADVILVNSSAGKDSQTMLAVVVAAAEAAGVRDRITVLHCDLGLTPGGRPVEWPGTGELARRQAEHYKLRFETRRRNGGALFDQIAARGKWPSANARYCTSDQKRGPARRLITDLVTELGLNRQAQVINCLGLRAEESRARARRQALTREDAASSGRREVWTWLPILDWTERQVWSHIRASGVPYHTAYDQGMTRLSCSLCVLASRDDLVCAARLRPDLAGEYAELETAMGHRFKADLSMAQIVAAAGAA